MAKKPIFDKWKDNLVSSVEAIKEGVNNTTKSQSANAIKAEEKYIAGMAKSIEKRSWKKGLEEAGDEPWKKGMLGKGVNSISSGITAKQDKIKVKMQKVQEVGEKIHEATKDMPNNNIEDALAKMRTTMTMAKAEWGKD